jgi:hypothetical protein
MPTMPLATPRGDLAALLSARSTFVEPNPSEPARGSKFRYPSHNLRFKLNRPNEDRAQIHRTN